MKTKIFFLTILCLFSCKKSQNLDPVDYKKVILGKWFIKADTVFQTFNEMQQPGEAIQGIDYTKDYSVFNSDGTLLSVHFTNNSNDTTKSTYVVDHLNIHFYFPQLTYSGFIFKSTKNNLIIYIDLPLTQSDGSTYHVLQHLYYSRQ